MRYYVPTPIILKNYQSKIKPLIQKGSLVDGCTSFCSLNPILMMQQKTIRMINFKKKYDTISKFIFENKILTVIEL